MKTDTHILSYLAGFFSESEMFRKNCRENQNTHFISKIYFFLNRGVCEIMWKNIVQRAGHRWQNGACALHAEYLRLQAHTHNV